MNSPWTFALRSTAITTAALVLLSHGSTAQNSGAAPTAPAADAVRELDSQVRELRAMIDQMRSENAESRTEMRELRQELQDTRKLLMPLASAASATGSAGETARSTKPASAGSISEGQETSNTPTSADAGTRLQRLEESTQLMGSKIDEQYQTKVETAAKYRARLSGIVLMNAFRNVGTSDNLDIPDYAQPPAPGSTSGASFGATLRQSEIGLEIFGPTLAGAKTSANVQFDFAGGFPADSKRSQLWHCANANGKFAARLEEHFPDRRPGFLIYLAAFSHVVCIPGDPGAGLCRQSVGLDATTARRASIQSSK